MVSGSLCGTSSAALNFDTTVVGVSSVPRRQPGGVHHRDGTVAFVTESVRLTAGTLRSPVP